MRASYTARPVPHHPGEPCIDPCRSTPAGRILSAMSDPVSRLNTALEGRYAIERELGEGGMATVYLADDLRHERKVALKVLKPELAAVVGAERFLAEIKTTANLQHPHILPLFDSGEADSFLFYVMPCVEGETLQDRIDREKQLPVDEAVRIATAVANALDHAHRNKIIHRDIKPANILLQDGEPVVADFGIALAVGAAGGHRLTETGLSLGTPYYMSPEQATGDQIVGAQSDVYALACVLYEMLVGEPPYTGTTAQAVLGKIIQGAPVSATSIRGSIPANVDAAMVRALEKLPADRFTGAQDFAKALADPGFRHGELAERGVTAGVGPWKRLTIAGWSAAAVFAMALGWTLLRAEPPRPVERFESPFRDGQRPVIFDPESFSLSPDGSMVVYQGPGPSGGTIQLWVRRWDDLDAAPVRGTVNAGTPSVSPDGRELAFAQESEIKVLAFEGGPIRTLTTGGWPRWGTDGYIYASVGGGSVRVPVTGGPADTVTQVTGDDAEHIIFDFLPGGENALLHVTLAGGEFEVRAVDLATGEMKSLMFGAEPLYASTGHLVAWMDGTLMVAPFDPNAVELLGPAVALMDGVETFSMSRTGSLVYVAGAAGGEDDSTELVWMTRSGSATPLQPGWAFDPGGTNYGWSLSPDGARVALRRRTEGNNDIWIKELPAGPLRRLTFDEGEQREPWWSADGQTVMYSSGVVGDRNVWSRPADGTGVATLVHDDERSLGQGTWSPDGEWLVFRTMAAAPNEGDRDIVALRPGADSTVTPLVATSVYTEHAPAVSPDGRWLAYSSNETGRDEVFVRPFPDVESGKQQISTEGGMAPRWAHSGRELFYVNGSLGLVAASIETDPGFRVLGQETLFTIPSGYLLGPGLNFYDVAPDDERFLMGRNYQRDGAEDGGGGPTLILVRNFFEELKERVGN